MYLRLQAFKVYNVCSERKYDHSIFNPQGGKVSHASFVYYNVHNFCSSIYFVKVARYPFPDHNPCPFDVMEGFCEVSFDISATITRILQDVRAFLDEHPQNVVGIHCKV
jgi:hypothetical protein